MSCTINPLRTAAIGCRIQPALLIPCRYSKSSARIESLRRAPLSKRHISFRHSPRSISVTKRAASTTAIPENAGSDGAADMESLNWNTFFKLRTQRRWWQMGSSVGCGATGFVGGASFLTNSDMDSIVSQIPLDPFISLGLITFAFGGVGWLVGPIIGGGIFNWRIGKSKRVQMGEKEVEFYKRVKKYRVDPSASSMANPVPDYYGEKIASVAGYRQWLKDQRAFNKKRQTYV